MYSYIKKKSVGLGIGKAGLFSHLNYAIAVSHGWFASLL